MKPTKNFIAKAGTKLRKPVSEKQVVFTLVERGGMFAQPTFQMFSQYREAIFANANLKASFMTDEHTVYQVLGPMFSPACNCHTQSQR